MERLKSSRIKRKCSTPYCRNEAAPQRTKCWKCKSRKVKDDRPEYYHFKALRDNARRRGKQFDLTLAQFTQFCKETGYMDSKGKTAQSFSIDRIRSWEGYNINNIQILTLSENTKKQRQEEVEDYPF